MDAQELREHHEPDVLGRDIEQNGCGQCGEELQILFVDDERLGDKFCTIVCQLKHYQESYDRLINAKNRISQQFSGMALQNDRLVLQNDRLAIKNDRLALNYNTCNKSLKNANAELATVYDACRNAMISTGQKETL